MEGNTSVYQVNPVSRITGEGRSEYISVRTGHRCHGSWARVLINRRGHAHRKTKKNSPMCDKTCHGSPRGGRGVVRCWEALSSWFTPVFINLSLGSLLTHNKADNVTLYGTISSSERCGDALPQSIAVTYIPAHL